MLSNFVIVPSITYGSQLALGAIGVTLIYGVLRFANFAYGDLMAFIVKQRSGKENFTIIPPEIEDARGSETGTVLVNGVHAIGDTTIAMDAFAGDGAGRFKAGDFLKFASICPYFRTIRISLFLFNTLPDFTILNFSLDIICFVLQTILLYSNFVLFP